MFARAALALGLALAGLAPAKAADGGRYGQIEVAAPKTAPRGLVILFSDAGGLKPRDRARLDAIADAGAIAVGVNVDDYLSHLAKAEPGCLILFRDAEHLSRQLQREHPGPLYRVPVVAGEGLGAALAGRIVAQSPLQTVGGALSLDPAAALPLQRELCPGAGDGGRAGAEEPLGRRADPRLPGAAARAARRDGGARETHAGARIGERAGPG
jgi:type IV secretory pathway VirJ component